MVTPGVNMISRPQKTRSQRKGFTLRKMQGNEGGAVYPILAIAIAVHQTKINIE